MEEEGEPGEEGERMREKELSLQRRKNESEKKSFSYGRKRGVEQRMKDGLYSFFLLQRFFASPEAKVATMK